MNDDIARNAIRDVLGAIAPEVDLDTIDPSGQLTDELDLDSMNFLDFVAGLHTETGIEVPERDYPQIATLDSCVAYLCAHAPV